MAEVIVPLRRRPLVRPSVVPADLWPIALCTVGVAPLFFVGASALAWSVPAVVLGASLLRDRTARVPVGGGALIALLAWMALSGLQLRSVPGIALFVYRTSTFASMAAVFIWLCHVSTAAVPSRTIIRVVAWGFPVLVAFGYLAILWPTLSLPSPVQQVLPGSLATDEFVRDLTTIRFAELQRFVGYPVPRVAAPFPYANGWGAAMAVTLPFWIVDRCVLADRGRRAGGFLGLAIGVVPIVVSLNRGLWLGIGITVLYVAVRRFQAGDRRTAVRVPLAAIFVALFVWVTPLGDLVADRFEKSDDSNAARENVASEAFTASQRSPLLGHGAPGRAETGPSVGTHGLWWYLMYCHGFVGAALFATWLFGAIRRAVRVRDQAAVWLTGSLLAVPVLGLVYGLLPQVVLVGVLAGVLRRSDVAALSPQSVGMSRPT